MMLFRAFLYSSLLSRGRSLAPSVVRHAGTLYKRSALLTQFSHLKEQYQNHILLFQVGDFYEIYGQDAGIVRVVAVY